MSTFIKPLAPQGLWATIQGLPRLGLLVALGCITALALLRFITFFVLATGDRGFAAWVDDDFFYYAVIAQNIADTGRSTFDQVVLSNGYHPLWMVVCVVLAKIFPITTAGYFVAIFIVQTALVAAGVVVLARLLDKVEQAGLIGPGGRLIACVIYGVVLSVTCANGMEVALLAPLAPAFLLALWRLVETPVLTRAMVAGALLCAVILSRLDMIVVFAPVSVGAAIMIWRRVGLGTLLKLLPALLTLLPFAAYLLINHLVFGSAMPLSGLAKRLTVDDAPFGLSALSLGSFIHIQNPNFLFAPVGVLVLTVLGVVLTIVSKGLRTSVAGFGFLLIVAGVLLFHLQTALTSDWRLWMWYFFALILVGSLGSALLAEGLIQAAPKSMEVYARIAPLAVAVLVLGLAVKANGWQLRHPPSVANALFVRAGPIGEFAKTHPGRYAVGDGGGAIGYFLPRGAVHLEGLVNDKAMLDDLRKQGSIEASLKRQGVDYYITSEPHPPATGCHELREPLQAGPKAPHLTQRVCEEPVFAEKTDWISTQIWDVRDGLN